MWEIFPQFLILVTLGDTNCHQESSDSLTSASNYHLTLKMASALVVEMSVTNNSPSQDSNHPDDLFQSRYVTTAFKLFSYVLSSPLTKAEIIYVIFLITTFSSLPYIDVYRRPEMRDVHYPGHVYMPCYK